MIRYVRERSLAGFTSNSDIAAALRTAFDLDIGERDVARWRKQYAAFDHVCSHARDEIHAELTMIAVEQARKGDMQTLRWLMERTSPAFMPKSKTELSGRVNTLDETLRERVMDEEAARQKGLIYDADEGV